MFWINFNLKCKNNKFDDSTDLIIEQITLLILLQHVAIARNFQTILFLFHLLHTQNLRAEYVFEAYSTQLLCAEEESEERKG